MAKKMIACDGNEATASVAFAVRTGVLQARRIFGDRFPACLKCSPKVALPVPFTVLCRPVL